MPALATDVQLVLEVDSMVLSATHHRYCMHATAACLRCGIKRQLCDAALILCYVWCDHAQCVSAMQHYAGSLQYAVLFTCYKDVHSQLLAQQLLWRAP
eukprot:5730-Heterococcus_DN1.PRE.5